jgi:hypothetical protein
VAVFDGIKTVCFYIDLKIYNFFAWLYEVDSMQNESIEIYSERLFIKINFFAISREDEINGRRNASV